MKSVNILKSKDDILNRITFSIRFKVILGVIVIMLMIMTGMTFVLIEKSKEDMLLQMEKRGEVLVRYLEKTIQARFDSEDMLLTGEAQIVFSDMIAFFLREPENIALTIIHSSGRILGIDSEQTGTHFGDVESILQKYYATGIIAGGSQIDRDKMIIIHPITVNGTFAGLMRAVFSLDAVMENLSNSRKSTFKVIFVESLVIIVFISLLLSMIVARPIERLVKITHNIASGDLDSRVEIVSKDEFGYLASAFNQMTEKLQITHRSLQGNIESLEEAYKILKETQDHLIASEKLASVGRLAAGVAHEIGNPLSSILGYTDILTMPDIDDAAKLDYIQKIQQAIDRIQKIIRELLDFSRPSSLEVHPIHAVDVLERTITLVTHHPSFQQIQITRKVPPNLPLVMADEHPLSQVFLNLLINAAHAINKRRKMTEKLDFVRGVHDIISVTAEIIEADSKSLIVDDNRLIVGEKSSYQIRGDSYLRMRFIDKGIGIQEENLRRVFDPFFSTKNPGEGSGLGLTICHTIIERLHGVIRIDSEYNEGTVVTIQLPVAEVINHVQMTGNEEKNAP